jgi:hypothetical protein
VADVDLKLSERAGSAATCVFCKEPLGTASVSCPGCGVGLHAACRDEVSRCPTLGCGQTWERRASAAAAARTQATPIEGFRPILRGTGERGPELAGESRKLRLLVLLLLPVFVVMFAIIEAVENAGASRRHEALEAARERAAQVADAARRAEEPRAFTREERDEALRLTAEAIGSGVLVVAGNEPDTWRAGSLEAFEREARGGHEQDPGALLLERLSVTGGANGLGFVDARALLAGVRLRALAALPAVEADAWARHAQGSSAVLRVDLDRLEHGEEAGRPLRRHTRAALEVTFVLEAVRDDEVDLRATATNGRASLTWFETWPRALDPSLRLSVLTLTDDPDSTVVLQRISRPARAVTANADGVTLQVFHEGGLPLPWYASVQRDVDGQRSYRVQLELLSFTPAP